MKTVKASADTKWSIDVAHSEIGFKVKHLMIANVTGSFKDFDASIYTTGNDFTTAQIDFWIDATTISTGDEKRDEHLKGVDYFDVMNHKQITFNSSSMENPDQEGNQILWGELTIKGIKKNVKLNVQFGGTVKNPWGKEKVGFTVTGRIKRSDWELSWYAALETGGFMVSDEVIISCEIELINMGQKDLKMVIEPANEKNSVV